jgi:hypothetical protein
VGGASRNGWALADSCVGGVVLAPSAWCLRMLCAPCAYKHWCARCGDVCYLTCECELARGIARGMTAPHVRIDKAETDWIIKDFLLVVERLMQRPHHRGALG